MSCYIDKYDGQMMLLELEKDMPYKPETDTNEQGQ